MRRARLESLRGNPRGRYLSTMAAQSGSSIPYLEVGIRKRKNVVYFQSPTEIKSLSEIDKSKIRVGGMVKKNSISISSNEVNFIITDFKNEINVTYSGAVPNLFAEGKGVVAEGFLKDRNFFSATKILAKHDENYMPPEVKEALGEK